MLSNCAGEDLDSKEIKSVNPKGKQYQENGSRIRIALYFSTATQLINAKKRQG